MHINVGSYKTALHKPNTTDLSYFGFCMRIIIKMPHPMPLITQSHICRTIVCFCCCVASCPSMRCRFVCHSVSHSPLSDRRTWTVDFGIVPFVQTLYSHPL